jgi:hypothetical protein
MSEIWCFSCNTVLHKDIVSRRRVSKIGTARALCGGG